jgi:alkylation response protein AidB-like acyl-CoA dehydrogenase
VTAGVAESPATAFLDRLADVVAAVKAGAQHRDAQRSYPIEEIKELRDLKFWALSAPAEFGGLGLGPDTVVRAVLALSAADGSLGQIPQNHFMTVERIRLTTVGEQRAHWLTAIGSGAILGNAAAEPADLPPGELGTRLRQAGGRWILNGRKVYATGSLLADHIAVLARDEGGTPRFVLVGSADPGVVLHDDWQGLGQRTTASGTAEFHDVEVDPIGLLPATAEPVATYRTSSLGQLIHAAIDAGIAAGALTEAIALARRVHGGRGGATKTFDQDVLGVAQLGELHISALSARRLVESAADRLATLQPDSDLADVVDVFYEVAAAKTVSTRASLAVTTALFEIGGTSSTHPTLGLDRYWRDARTHTLHDAVRWKPYAAGRWLLDRSVADAWSIGHPFRTLDELQS